MLKIVDGRAFAHVDNWECRKAGFYLVCEEERIEAAVHILSSERFHEYCQSVCEKWPISSAVHLTNTATNRRAWLGQAACFASCSVVPDRRGDSVRLRFAVTTDQCDRKVAANARQNLGAFLANTIAVEAIDNFNVRSAVPSNDWLRVPVARN